LPGGFYPALGYPVAWSLVNAPPGVTIDSHGLMTLRARECPTIRRSYFRAVE
jgi:hypothetical protein